MSEQDLINKYFAKATSQPQSPPTVSSVITGIGDDAAVLSIPPGYELVVSMDTLIGGVHFPDHTTPRDIGYKSLAVSLSDMAAMGAEPKTALLALTIPAAENSWLEEFASGFFELIKTYQMELIGGDTTRGPLSITTVVNGMVPLGQALYRKNARPNDAIYVTGLLGEAAMGLGPNPNPSCLQCLNRPTPRVAVGLALRALATAAIDLSDGLAIDLEKLCAASGVGAEIQVEQIPRNSASIELALTGGDDYELCFTVPPSHEPQLVTRLNNLCAYKKIGLIKAEKSLQFIKKDKTLMNLSRRGYDHF